MNNRLLKFLKRNFFVLSISLIVAILAWQNYTPGTFLTGWDTLHPEFNFPLNIKRDIFGVWRENLGMGVLDGHSGMSDLPRVIFIFFASFVLPTSFLRYFYFFITLLLGPLGMFYLLRHIVFKNNSLFQKDASAFSGSLFYLLNLGTMQHFYVPFEMFTTLYAFLPWLLLLATQFIFTKSKKYLILFSIITLISTPMAYAATLWYAYFAFLLIYLGFLFFTHKKNKKILKKIRILVIVTLLINSFWLLPQLYLMFTSAGNIPDAKINQIFSIEAFAHDSKFANLWNVIFLQGFLFDWQQYSNSVFSPVLAVWKSYLSNPIITLVGISLFLPVIFGIITSVKKRDKVALSILFPFLFSFLFLVHDIPLLKQIFYLLRDHFTLFREGLRFPWSKFSIFVIFGYAFYFSIAINNLIIKTKNFKKILVLLTTITFLLCLWMLPAFSGQFIGQITRIPIPKEYQEAFKWFKEQPNNTRIAFLPIPTFRGWEYYNWGYQGAGFIWFGLPQAISTRDSDRWGKANENFYWELSYAIYSKNQQLIDSVLDKYQINWLLLDKNMLNPSNPKGLATEQLFSILDQDKIHLTKQFGNIEIFKVGNINNSGFIYQVDNLLNIVPKYQWNNFDQAHQDFNVYKTDSNPSDIPDVYYPFRSLFTGKIPTEIGTHIEESDGFFLFKKNLPNAFNNFQLNFPNITDELVYVNPKNIGDIKYLNPKIATENGQVQVLIPKPDGYFSAQIKPDDKTIKVYCNNKNDSASILNKDNTRFIQLNSKIGSACYTTIDFPQLPHNLSYIITVQSSHKNGLPIKFWLENLTNGQSDLETYMPKSSNMVKSYFIQPPEESDGVGYRLHFDNESLGSDPATNEIGQIEIYTLPYHFLSQINFTNTIHSTKQEISPIPYRHPNQSLYIIENFQGKNLILSQSWNIGWQAYEINSKFRIQNSELLMWLAPIFGQRIKEHLLINNWENGWSIKNTGTHDIVIIYLPQYLEFLGFILFFASIQILLLLRKDYVK